MIIIGIDPGNSGGLATYTAADGYKGYNLPNDAAGMIKLVSGLITDQLETKIYIEDPPKTVGVKRAGAHMYSFGRVTGLIEGVVAGMGLPYTMVRPQEWQAITVFHNKKGMKQADWKRLLKDKAKEHYPKATLKTADAVLIARYGVLMNDLHY